jgi:hypothetical protein
VSTGGRGGAASAPPPSVGARAAAPRGPAARPRGRTRTGTPDARRACEHPARASSAEQSSRSSQLTVERVWASTRTRESLVPPLRSRRWCSTRASNPPVRSSLLHGGAMALRGRARASEMHALSAQGAALGSARTATLTMTRRRGAALVPGGPSHRGPTARLAQTRLPPPCATQLG